MKKKVTVVIMAFTMLCTMLFGSKVYASQDYKLPEGNFVVSEKKTTLAPGVVETEMIYNNQEGQNPVSNFIIDIDMGSNAKIMAASKNYNQTGVQTVMEMADATKKKTNRNIVAGINADLNWNGNGLSTGPLIVDGLTKSDIPDVFFGITKNGEAIAGDAKQYKTIKEDLVQAIRSRGWLVKDGTIKTQDKSLAPRTAVGIKADGSVFFYVVEGRMFPRSVGISLVELADIMKSYGAVNALELDGGGSTTYIAKNEGENDFKLRSIPSDGVERASISSLFVYTEVGDGKFNHAAITTEDAIYTPDSTVQFSASGVDNAGGAAELPKGLKWQLKDSKFGKIDAKGLFTSNGAEGIVNIELMKDKEKVGEGSVEIRTPDEINFRDTEFSLGFDESTDFGLWLSYKKQAVTFKDGDVVWNFDAKLGTMKNNVFTSNLDLTTEGNIQATVKGSTISKQIKVVVGKLPIVLFDFENDAINEKWNAESVNNASSEISIVDKASGEPVRFGDKSLRMDFNFEGTTRYPGGAYAGFRDKAGLEDLGVQFELPGSPKSVGMWIYATEEAQGLWLRTGVGVEGTTAWKAFNLTPEASGIDWIGWKYVEVDLTDFSGPYMILPGQFIRLMLTGNSFGGEEKRPLGSIYVDNITVSYGTNTDDVVSPEIDSISINQDELANGTKIATSNVTIGTQFHDPENKYTSAIDFDNVDVYIDGVSYKNNAAVFALDRTYEQAFVQNVNLTDGDHEVKVVVTDQAGNEKIERRFFTVDTETKNKVYLEQSENAIIGKEYDITLKADEIANIDSIDVSLLVSDTLMNNYEVEFSDAFEGSSEYLPGVRLLNIKGKRKAETTADYIFKLKNTLSSDLNENSTISYSVNYGKFAYANDITNDYFLKSFSIIPQEINVGAPLKMASNVVLVGQDAVFTVTDVANNPVENAEIYQVNGAKKEKIGVTDGNGQFITQQFSDKVTSFVLVASKDKDISFEFTGQSFDSIADEGTGKPYGVHLNGVKNPESSKNISWMSSALSNNHAYLDYALKTDFDKKGEQAFTRVEGTGMLNTYSGSKTTEANKAVYVNNVSVTGLVQGQDYAYRVGNGEIWSEVKSFKTNYKNSDTKFVILGDVQTEDFDQFKTDLSSIEKNTGNDYDFSIQVGDLVDDASVFDQWYEIMTNLSDSHLGDVDMLHVLGNHEFYGDVNADKSAVFFNMPTDNLDYYSVEYQNTYIGVMNYEMDRTRINQALQWLSDDANKSDARWRILVTHQPPYYTNPQGGNEIINELLPGYAEKAGFDFVFSGHDHAYARTKPMIGGQPNDEGIVYIVTGALGQKRYPATNNPDFHFETYKVLDATDPIYITVNATYDSFTVETRSVNTGEIYDTYTKTKEVTEDIRYTLDGDRLISSDGKHNRPIGEYTGMVDTPNGKEVYLVGGKRFNGFLYIDDVLCYFDKDGIAQGPVKEGFYQIPAGTVYVNKNGEIVNGWKEISGHTYYFSTTDGVMRTGKKVNIQEKYYDFGTDGKLLDSKGNPVDASTGFIRTPEGPVYYLNKAREKLKGWQIIDGYQYYFSTQNGEMRSGRKVNVGGQYYNFATDGKLLDDKGNPVKVEENKTGFISTENGIVYKNDAGKILKGWQDIDGYRYYFSSSNGVMRIGKKVNVLGQYYNFATDGKLLDDKGNPVKVEENKIGFISTENGIVYKNDAGKILKGWQDIDGYRYYFSSSNGVMRIGKKVNVLGQYYNFATDGKLLDDKGNPVKVEENKTGFISTENGIVYKNDAGKILKGWQDIDGYRYYFSSSNGVMRIGKKVNVLGQYYNFATDGKLLDDKGNPVKVEENKTGFISTENGIVYKNDAGKILKGWQDIDGYRYYFSSSNGVMRIGKKVNVLGQYYNFAADGKLLDDKGNPVKVEENKTGFVSTENGIVYKNDAGKILKGWQDIDGYRYYFSSSNGVMRTGKKVNVLGEYYNFENDGKLIGKYGKLRLFLDKFHQSITSDSKESSFDHDSSQKNSETTMSSYETSQKSVETTAESTTASTETKGSDEQSNEMMTPSSDKETNSTENSVEEDTTMTKEETSASLETAESTSTSTIESSIETTSGPAPEDSGVTEASTESSDDGTLTSESKEDNDSRTIEQFKSLKESIYYEDENSKIFIGSKKNRDKISLFMIELSKVDDSIVSINEEKFDLKEQKVIKISDDTYDFSETNKVVINGVIYDFSEDNKVTIDKETLDFEKDGSFLSKKVKLMKEAKIQIDEQVFDLQKDANEIFNILGIEMEDAVETESVPETEISDKAA